MPNLIGQAPPPPSPGGRSFAAALRNLAKQAGPPSTHSNGKIYIYGILYKLIL